MFYTIHLSGGVTPSNTTAFLRNFIFRTLAKPIKILPGTWPPTLLQRAHSLNKIRDGGTWRPKRSDAPGLSGGRKLPLRHRLTAPAQQPRWAPRRRGRGGTAPTSRAPRSRGRGGAAPTRRALRSRGRGGIAPTRRPWQPRGPQSHGRHRAHGGVSLPAAPGTCTRACMWQPRRSWRRQQRTRATRRGLHRPWRMYCSRWRQRQARATRRGLRRPWRPRRP